MQSIPKIIHYCWFGKGVKSEKIKHCMESWRKFLPDYEIIEWNEYNFDVNSCVYTAQAYQTKKWAFVSDYARLYALYHHGGIYLDTDVEIRKPLDDFLENSFFTGFEANDSLTTAVMGAKKHNPHIEELLSQYKDRVFLKEDGSIDDTPNTIVITSYMLHKGILSNGKKQEKDGVTVYPQIYFCPNNFLRIFEKYSEKTYAVHHCEQSWMDDPKSTSSLPMRVRRYLVNVGRNIFGTNTMYQTKQMIIRWIKESK